MIEDTCIFLNTRKEYYRRHNVASCLYKWRCTEHKSVRSCKLFLYRFHTNLSLLCSCSRRHNSPNLSIKVNLTFFYRLSSVNSSVFGNSPYKPFSVPAFFLNICVECVAFLQSPCSFVLLSKAFTNICISCKTKSQLECNKERLTMVTKLQTVIPVCKQSARKSICTHAFKIEFKGTAQVAINCCFTTVGIRNNFIIKIKVSGFCNITRNSIKEPFTVVATEFFRLWSFFVAGIKIFRNYRNSTTILALTAYHANKAFFCFFRNCSRNTKNILNRIAVTKTIAFTVINKTGCTRPCKCNQTVIKSPNIYSVVNIFIRCNSLVRTKLCMPVCYKLIKFFICTLKVTKFIYDFLANNAGVTNTKHKHDFFSFARSKF